MCFAEKFLKMLSSSQTHVNFNFYSLFVIVLASFFYCLFLSFFVFFNYFLLFPNVILQYFQYYFNCSNSPILNYFINNIA